MGKNLLSIDWDYFIPIKREWRGSYIENKKNIVYMWYRRYFKGIERGENIEKSIKTGKILVGFWKRLKQHFVIKKKTKICVSDSHKISYYIAENDNCDKVVNFDSHSDLGYGGMKSLDFEVNCANWLGKLLKNRTVKKAVVVYSPYTYENKEDFKEINDKFDVSYPKMGDLKGRTPVDYVHICRSGSWTPPWLDYKFYEFISALNRPCEIVNCPERRWNPEKLTLSDKIILRVG
ncbi:MAG TPA: arginase [Clostridium sp.]|jgi:hypothetical protein|uniref:Arginase n=1 Tax=Clostridium lapidicellarium TaxID=3240931 RepID=A0ABV4DY63_9CLOT|nr:arginase [uncultured Clostridium sp.]NLU08643.1 arginase [Clostridiales bacterium]HBC96479.1 arginase [Clostridium sp.]